MEDFELNYPSELPVCALRREILAAIRDNCAVIVSGDTGSGKTTQLPKMALELGRAAGGKRIACTQPRRIAAVSMAERVAAELKCEIGGTVGYRHRFARRCGERTRIEFMTDGILLSETRADPLLESYDTIIIDEAHERSLNIDFLLGILKRILKRRKDLRVIISSATLDTGRFTDFFTHAARIEVPGRLFPIEMRYMPPPEDSERDLPRDIAEAVATLPADGDILVFLPGERDIRETAEMLSGRRGADDEILPLYASLPAGEQRRVFAPSAKRKIVLATNVAETSLTIPGIRAVVDTGLARISRYIHRSHVQRLQIEPVSKASARQRAGRCGRIGPGICIRLYSREDFEGRDDFTPPEILRSSLAGVILSMLDLRLGDIDRFEFIDPPRPAMIREGLRELLELGAIRRADAGGARLTETGRKLAGIPVEPRLARILLEASRNAVLRRVIPLVAAMACDDPRRRPFDEREAADRAHARFRKPGSDFLGTLELWDWWQRETEDLSESKKRKLCKSTFLSYPKMREWRDLVRQLETLTGRIGLGKCSGGEESADLIHRSLLAGLLGRIGRFDEQERNYRGAHAIRFSIHPSSVLKRKTEPWVMAGELVDTGQLFARNAAAIDPAWIEPAARDLCRRSHHSPEWDERSGFVRAIEQVTLYGLTVVPARRCDYSRINPDHARQIFIGRGIVDGEFPRPPPALARNLATIASLRRRSERLRRPETFDENGLAEFFDRTIPPGIASADALRKWLRCADAGEIKRFTLVEKDWIGSADETGFPDCVRIAGKTFPLSYRHAPERPDVDGVTCRAKASDVPVLKLWRSDWLVPGMVAEKLRYLLSSLPSQYRRLLQPLEDSANILLPLLHPGKAAFQDDLSRAIRERWGFAIPPEAWKTDSLPHHLSMRFLIVDDESGKTIAATRNLGEFSAKAKPAAAKPQEKSTAWTFGDIPERTGASAAELYPGLRDEGDGVSLRLYADANDAVLSHNAGVARLFAIALGKSIRPAFRRDRLPFQAALYLKSADYGDERIAEDIGFGAVCETLIRGKAPVRTAAEFAARLENCRPELQRTISEMGELFRQSVCAAAEISAALEDPLIAEETSDSVSTQLAWLMYRGFPRNLPLATFRNYGRYLKGAAIRLARAKSNRAGDLRKEQVFAPFWERYRLASGAESPKKMNRQRLQEFRWLLEEFRISVFAQELHTAVPVSAKRLEAKWLEAEESAQD